MSKETRDNHDRESACSWLIQLSSILFANIRSSNFTAQVQQYTININIAILANHSE